MRAGLLPARLRSADLAIPLVEHGYERLRVERWLDRVIRNQAGIFRSSELLDGILALLWRHLDRHMINCRAWIHVAVIVHERLLLGLEQIADQLQQDVDLFLRHAFGN